MFLLVFVAITLGFLFIFLIIGVSPRKKQTSLAKHNILENKWTREEFEKHCIDVVKGFGLEISSISQENEGIMEVLAENPKPFVGGRYIIYTLYNPADIVIKQEDIISLSTFVKYEEVSRGIFITTGVFPENVAELTSDSPIELIDGKKLEELIA